MFRIQKIDVFVTIILIDKPTCVFRLVCVNRKAESRKCVLDNGMGMTSFACLPLETDVTLTSSLRWKYLQRWIKRNESYFEPEGGGEEGFRMNYFGVIEKWIGIGSKRMQCERGLARTFCNRQRFFFQLLCDIFSLGKPCRESID